MLCITRIPEIRCLDFIGRSRAPAGHVGVTWGRPHRALVASNIKVITHSEPGLNPYLDTVHSGFWNVTKL